MTFLSCRALYYGRASCTTLHLTAAAAVDVDADALDDAASIAFYYE